LVVLLFFLDRLFLDIFFVLFQKDICILFMSTLRCRNIVLMCPQSLDDLCCCLIVCLPAFREKLGQRLIKAKHTDPCIINKFQLAPTNWWRRVIIPSVYSTRLKMCHLASPLHSLACLIWRKAIHFPASLVISIPTI